MAKSKDVESFLEEIRAQIVSGQRNPGVLMETWNSLTPPDQVRVLLRAVEGGASQSREALNQIFSNPEPAFEAGQTQQHNMMTKSKKPLDETQAPTATHCKQRETMDEQKQQMTEIFIDIKNLLKDAEAQSKDKLTDGTSTYDLMEIQLCQIQENMENAFNELKEYSTQVQSEKAQIETIKIKIQTERLDIESDRKLIDTEMDALKCTRKKIEGEMNELDNKLQRVKIEIREMEVVSREVQMKKKDLEKMIRSNRKRKEDTSTKPEETRKTVQDTEEGQNKTREKSLPQLPYICDQCKAKQMKWINFQAKKRRRELDCQLEQTVRQRDELEIVKIQIHQQKQDVEKKKQDVMTSVLTMANVKANMENVYEEIRSIMEDVLRIRSNMADYSKDLKKYQDSLASMKDQVNSWKMRKSSVGKIFLGDTVELEEHQKESKPNFKTGAIEDISEVKAIILLQPSVTLEGQDKVKESKHHHTPMETQIQDLTLPGKDEAQVVMDSSQRVDLEKKISELKGQVYDMKVQMYDNIQNVKEKSQKMTTLITKINELHCHEPDTSSHDKAIEVLTEILRKETMEKSTFRDQIKQDEVEYSTEANQGSYCFNTGIEKQTQNQDLKVDLQVKFEDKHDVSEANIPEDAAVKRLELEIHRTIEIINMFLLEIGYQITETNTNDQFKNEDGETERVFHKIKQFQELLQMVKTAIEQSNMCVKIDAKNMKFAVEKRRRELDHKLEQILRQRDELEILKIKVQRESIETLKNFENMTKCWSSITKIITKSREKNEKIKIRMKTTDIKLRLLEETNTTTDATQQQNMKRICLLKAKCTSELENIRNKIKKLKESNFEKVMSDGRKNEKVETDAKRDDQTRKAISKQKEDAEDQIITLTTQKQKLRVIKLAESLDPETINSIWSSKSTNNKKKMQRDESERRTQIQTEPVDGRVSPEPVAEESYKMNKQIEEKKQELNEHFQQMRREIQEMEILKSELQRKRKENEHVLRKLKRQRGQNEITLNKIKQENISLRRETRKKKRELDQRLEKTMRERDELEVFRLKMNRIKEELVVQQLHVKDKTPELHVYSEDRKQSLEKSEKKSFQEAIFEVHLSTETAGFIENLLRLKQQIHEHLVKIMADKDTLENLKVCLDQQKDGLKTFQSEKLRLSEEVIKVKAQMKTVFNKIIPEKEEKTDKMINTKDDVQNLELDVALGKVKRERQELELLVTELEIRKKENQRIVRKIIQKEQDVKRIWNEVKEEKDTLKRETQRRKKELGLRLESIIRERDELEVMKLRFNKEKEVFTGGMISLGMTGNSQVPGEIQNDWTLLQMCTKTYGNMKTSCEGLIEVIKGVKRHISLHVKIITNSKEETRKIQLEIKRQKEEIQSSVKRIQEEQRFLERNENTGKDQSHVRTEKKMKKSKGVTKRQSKTDTSIELDKSETTMIQIDKQEQDRNVMHQTKEPILEKALKGREKQNLKSQDAKHENWPTKKSGVKKVKENKQIEETKEALIALKDNSNKMKEEAEAAMLDLLQEQEKVSQMRLEVENERERCQTETDRIESEKSELKVREEQILDSMKSLESLESKLQELSKTRLEDFKEKMGELENKMGKTVKLYSNMEKQVKSFEKLKQNMAHYSENFQRQKEAMKCALFDVTKERDGKETEKRKMNDVERQELEKLREQLTQERQDLDIASNKMAEEKLNLELMKSEAQKLGEVMKQAEKDFKMEKDKMDIANIELQTKTDAANRLMEEMHRDRLGLKQLMANVDCQRKRLDDVLDLVVKQQYQRDSNEKEFQEQTEELKIRLKQVQAEREELNALKDNTNKMKEEAEAAMLDLLQEQEKVSQMRLEVENERERSQTLLDVNKDMDGMETEKKQIVDMGREDLDKHREEVTLEWQDLDRTCGTMKGDDLEISSVTEATDDHFEGKFQEYHLMNLFESLCIVIRKLKHFNAITFCLISENFDRLIQLNRQNSDALSEYERTINLESCKSIIGAILKFLRNKKLLPATLQSEKAVQTESADLPVKSQKMKIVEQDLLHPETDLLKPGVEKFSFKGKDEYLAPKKEIDKNEDHLNEEKRDHLRKIWKDTRIDQKEIRQMKSRSHEIRHNLEKRLKMVNQFVKRTVLQKGKTIVEDSVRVLNQSTESVTQSDSFRSSEIFNSRYLELQHLKATVLKEVENICTKGTIPNTMTSEKGNQTVQLDITTVSEQITGGKEGTHPETSQGLLCQLRHYCSRCCCLCCTCQKRMCPNEK